MANIGVSTSPQKSDVETGDVETRRGVVKRA